MVRSLKRIFDLEGYKSVTETSGAEAVKRIRDEPFDVVVTDVRMPGMSGIETLRKAREIRSDLPIILITGDAGSPPASEDPLVDILIKPFDPEQLCAIIESRIARSES